VPLISTPAGKLHYRESGDAPSGSPPRPPYLLVHGAGASSLPWLSMMRFLGRHRRVVALDLPGHGRSDPATAGTSPAALLDVYARAVLAVADAAGLAHPVLVGHSMGGPVVLAAALAAPGPQRPSGLGLIATAARLPTDPGLIAVAGSDPGRLQSLLVRAGFGTSTPEADRPRLAAEFGGAPPQVAADDFRLCAGLDLTARLREVDLPCACITATEDRLVAWALSEALQMGLPRAVGHRLTATGHLLVVEQPAAVAERLLALLP
jgi:pimeloyl-ACP methyl ester carboxylesterase